MAEQYGAVLPPCLPEEKPAKKAFFTSKVSSFQIYSLMHKVTCTVPLSAVCLVFTRHLYYIFSVTVTYRMSIW